MAKREAPARRWVFTLNNPDDATKDIVKNYFTEESCVYAIVGNEVGESGTPHLQGFAHLREKKRFTALKKILPSAHWERARGNDEQNQAYCSKQNIMIQVGQPQEEVQKGRMVKRACELIDVYAKNPDHIPEGEDRETMLLYGKRIKTMASELEQEKVKE